MTLRPGLGSRFYLSLLILIAFALPLQAQSPAKGKPGDGSQSELARRLVEASGAEAIILKTIELALPGQRAQNPKISPEFWDRFAAKARTDVRQLVDSLAPIYARRFSKTELEQLVAFYESPVGRHIVAEQGAIAQESQGIGVRWGTRLGAATAVEMADEGKPIQQ